MKLGEFIEKFVEKNTLVRLLYKIQGGHQIVLDSWDNVSMEWEILKGQGKNRHYINNEVVGIIGIANIQRYGDAVNITIEFLKDQPFIEEVVEDRSHCCEAE